MIGADADARSFLLQQHPALIRLLNERSLSTDDLESEFSALVTRTSFKPVAALDKLRAVDRIAAIRTTPDLTVHIGSARGSHYEHHQRAAMGDTTWNDESLLGS